MRCRNGCLHGDLGTDVNCCYAVIECHGRYRNCCCRVGIEENVRVVCDEFHVQVLFVFDKLQVAVEERNSDFDELVLVAFDFDFVKDEITLFGWDSDTVDFDVGTHDSAGAVILVFALLVCVSVVPADPFYVVVTVGKYRILYAERNFVLAVRF